MEKFRAFLLRASTCRSIFGSASSDANSRQIILLEDLPNILHTETQTQFHEVIQQFIQRTTTTYTGAAPLVIVISDAGLRGESGDDAGAGQITWTSKEIVDVRSVIPSNLIHSPYVTQIK
jgi:cell cycle checkpoint protein